MGTTSEAASGHEAAYATWNFPWFPAAVPQPSGYYHASTQLPSGHLAILVDPGAWTNIGGKRNIRRAAAKAVEAGYTPSQRRMDKPLIIQGVGNGFQTCEWESTLPIAVPELRQSFTTLELQLWRNPETTYL